MNTHMEKLFSQYLHEKKVRVSTAHFESLVLSHPLYPSLVSVTDVLDRLGIPYRAFKIDYKELNDLEFPYILHLNVGGRKFVYIDGKKTLQMHKNKVGSINGIVFRIGESNLRTVQERERHFLKEKLSEKLLYTTFSSLALLIIMALFKSFSWINLALMSTSLVGLITAYAVVLRELGVKVPIVQGFCGGNGDSKCDNILNSKKFKMFGVKLSDAVMVYFLFQCLFITLGLTLSLYYNAIVLILASISLLTIPIVLFSVYFQHFKAKAWCRLCMVVDVVLVIQSGLLVHLVFITDWKFSAFEIISYFGFAILTFIINGSLIMLIKQKREGMTSMEMDIAQYGRIVHSDSVFTSLLTSGSAIKMTPLDQEMLIGKPAAVVKIIMASNLDCNPCRHEYKQLMNLLSAYPDLVNVSIRFVFTLANGKATTHLMQYWLSNIYQKPHQLAETKKLIDDWFDQMSFDKFRKSYPLAGEEMEDQAAHLVGLHQAWIKESEVIQTPDFFINGFRLPKQYHLRDLLTLIPILADKDSLLVKGFITTFNEGLIEQCIPVKEAVS